MRLLKVSTICWLMLACTLFVFAAGEQEKAAKPLQIVQWTHEDPNRTPLEEKWIAEFQSEYPNVRVVRETSPSGKIKEKVLTAFAAMKGPDIFNLEAEDEWQYIVSERVAPVDLEAVEYSSYEALRNEYLPVTFNGALYEGKVYGMPMEITNWCIYINNKYYREVGLDPAKDYPKTWEQMVTVAEKLTIREGEVIKRRGFDFRYPYYLAFFVPMANQLGGTVLTPDGKSAAVDSPAWIKLLRYMADWGPNGHNLGSPTYTNARKTFNRDDNSIAMCISGLYQYDRIKAENEAFLPEVSVVPYPRFEDAVNDNGAAVYGHYYMVNSSSSPEVQEWAWKLIKYFTSHEEEFLDQVGLIIPSKKLLQTDVYRNKKFADVFIEDMRKSNFIMTHESGPKIQDVIKEMVEGVMLSNIPPAEAARRGKQKIDDILGM
ncbi:MAG: ABC transporter substrate-binding protein [Spirochaetes bacterium]|nr:MAG: ABC transporter substrate-binding protein [Spirochaetota bacterium]